MFFSGEQLCKLNWAVAKTPMSFSYNLTCLPRGLPRYFHHHSFSFRGWLVSWFCFRGASAKASSSWNLQIDLALMEIDWLWLWRIVGDVWFVCANICICIRINVNIQKSNTVLKSSSAALPRSDDQRLLPQALLRASADVGFISAGPT